MKRENLEKRPYCTIIASSNFPFYAAPEADAVMDEMEARIKEPESEVIGYKASLERANFKMCEKDARIKDLEAENERLKSIVGDEEYKQCLSGLAQRNAELREENEWLKAQVPKWISVKDRLPTKGTDVLVYTPIEEDVFGEGRTGVYDIVKWDFYHEQDCTHWMQLPPPPTTEESSATEKDGQ